MSPDEARVLVDFLDDSGDGQIEAFEVTAALRRLHKVIGLQKSGTRPPVFSLKNWRAARGQERKSPGPPPPPIL